LVSFRLPVSRRFSALQLRSGKASLVF
jgi:hypothetical protein